MPTFFKDLNDLSGVFLLLVTLLLSRCAYLLAGIKGELECLHQDFNTVHDTDRRWEPNP